MEMPEFMKIVKEQFKNKTPSEWEMLDLMDALGFDDASLDRDCYGKNMIHLGDGKFNSARVE